MIFLILNIFNKIKLNLNLVKLFFFFNGPLPRVVLAPVLAAVNTTTMKLKVKFLVLKCLLRGNNAI
jgi:hypothetical protein